jgi:hypothetical protein
LRLCGAAAAVPSTTSERPAGLVVIVMGVTATSVKFAVADLAALMVTGCGLVLPLTSPLQLVNWYPDAGMAVNWTTAPEL